MDHRVGTILWTRVIYAADWLLLNWARSVRATEGYMILSGTLNIITALCIPLYKCEHLYNISSAAKVVVKYEFIMCILAEEH